MAKGTIVLPADAWAAFRDLRDEPVEVFRVAFLDWGNHLMAYEDVARGTVSRVHIHPREVFFSAVHLRASSIIVLHNHDLHLPQPSTRNRLPPRNRQLRPVRQRISPTNLTHDGERL